jgi:hypothetical protein
MTNPNPNFGTNSNPVNPGSQGPFGYFPPYPYPQNSPAPWPVQQQASYPQPFYYYQNQSFVAPAQNSFSNGQALFLYNQNQAPTQPVNFSYNPVPAVQQHSNVVQQTSAPVQTQPKSQAQPQYRTTHSGRSKIMSQDQLLENNTPKTVHKQIPVNTGSARNFLGAFKSKITGSNFEPNAPTSGIIPVRIFSKKSATPAPEFREKKLPAPASAPSQEPQQIKQNLTAKASPAKQILANSNIYTKDFTDNLSKNITGKEKSKLPLKQTLKKPRKRNKLGRFVAATAILLTLVGGVGAYALNKNLVPAGFPGIGIMKSAVAGEVSYKGSDVENFEEYKKWILSQNSSQYSAPTDDLDNDQLTNYEEFILQTNPKTANTCDKESTDIENLLKLVDPVTCKQIDLNNNNLVAKYSQVINLPNIQAQLVKSLDSDAQKPATPENLLQLFGVDAYSKIDSLTEDQVSKEIMQKNTKIEYLRTIKKIDSYIEKYRSYKTGDRDYPTPVRGAVYLDVSLRYNTPLKYSLAIARLESRFGTDRFTPSGELTRPAQYQNIYSMGLTDSSSSGFNTWEAGVESFGKWYKRFEDRKVSDCAKWKIYNPNGDYCSKVEALATEIDSYLKS